MVRSTVNPRLGIDLLQYLEELKLLQVAYPAPVSFQGMQWITKSRPRSYGTLHPGWDLKHGIENEEIRTSIVTHFESNNGQRMSFLRYLSVSRRPLSSFKGPPSGASKSHRP